MSDTNAALIVSIVGISDLAGRIFGGWLADLKYFKRKTVFQISMLLFGLCMFITPHINSLLGMCVISTFLGVTTGCYIGTQVSVLADTFGIGRLSSSLGFTFFCASFALLTSPFLSGLIKDISGSWTNSIRLGAASAVFGSLLVFLVPLVEQISRKSTNNDLMVDVKTINK
ncbi:hypothetical protein KUTeg_020974 [Tegillarca granosa]|uniref:Major facilitator superfamily (MFS) profile domain-containing protein n=1 Tax=Tegillarca granosa TaxID=220873 RepID=A0ABQ9E9I8_TEGGR|nr:hypothetical protein KUTeg_020974 [Tegillarca granosa]